MYHILRSAFLLTNIDSFPILVGGHHHEQEITATTCFDLIALELGAPHFTDEFVFTFFFTLGLDCFYYTF